MTGSASDRDTLRRELARVRAALEDLPPDAFAERERLRTRLHELRGQLQAMGPSGTVEQLEVELRQLLRRREELARQLSAYSPADGQGLESAADTALLNRGMRAGLGIDDLDGRIRELRRLLVEHRHGSARDPS